jgi:hypothetical protein
MKWLVGISGNNLVGEYYAGGVVTGFLYDGTTWTSLNKPGASGTAIFGIDGSNLVGEYYASGGWHGFIYNTKSEIWTTLNAPTGGATIVYDISGENLVGACWDGEGHSSGFLYDGMNYTLYSVPIYGIDGSNLIGQWSSASNFLYDGTTYTVFDNMPVGAYGTSIYGIGGNKIVGFYTDISVRDHGFIYIIPEPATVLLLGGGIFLRSRNKV